MQLYRIFGSVILIVLGCSMIGQTQNVGVGTNVPDPSALLDVSSTNQGMPVHRMTTSQYVLNMEFQVLNGVWN